ncbi:hypothetical protein BC938DRAFT_483910 [Jimgerdemannia flammicorona]|uniref:Uncharacterized protein n=1 Tax=Jimgerdemannia flammicorona TaxID=994334 RepID=A0A433QAY0_9FUNG|nr:hypothetical protein BC938DRAFT_483910 [Jimgerdemannia flammicorona]
MANSSKFLASLPLIPFAIVVFVHLISSLGPWMEPIQAACKNPELAAQQGIRTIYTDVAPIDGFLCWIVPFFQESLKTPAAFVVHCYLYTVANTYFGLAAMEGSRASLSKTIISWVPLFGLIGQFIGISVAVPLLWIPLYAYKSSRLPTPNHAVLPARALAIPISLLIGAVSVEYNILFPSSPRAQQNAVALFQPCVAFPTIIAFVLTPLFNFVTPSSLSRRTAARTAYASIALANLAIHVYLLAYAREHQVDWAALRSLLDVPSAIVSSSRTFANSIEQGQTLCSHFLFVDTIVLALSLVYWVALESGVVPAVLTLLASFVVGPGAALPAYAIWREGELENVEKKDV